MAVASGVDTTFLVELEVEESARHPQALRWLKQHIVAKGESLVLCPQVLTEFIHVVTDARRFARPLTASQAASRAEFWWQAREVRQVFPTAATTTLFFRWLAEHGLGRKRLLDTYLAATYVTAEVPQILSTNARDFSLYEGLRVITP